jgi:hypothetical protein
MNTHPRYLSELAAKYSFYVSNKQFNELLNDIREDDPEPLVTLESWLIEIKDEIDTDAYAYDDFYSEAY